MSSKLTCVFIHRDGCELHLFKAGASSLDLECDRFYLEIGKTLDAEPEIRIQIQGDLARALADMLLPLK